MKKKLANELKPDYIKKGINQVDKAYSQLLTANNNLQFTDFGAGYYAGSPKVARGEKEKLEDGSNDIQGSSNRG